MKSRSTSRAAGLLVCLAVSAGCGAEVLVDGDGGGGTGATGTGTGNTGGTTASTTSTSTGAGGSPGVCESYRDEPGLAPVGLRFLNLSEETIYLPVHCGWVRYDLRSAGESAIEYGYDPFCLQTCENLQTEPRYECDDCPSSSIVLQPGDELVVEWDGAGRLETTMPESCWELPGGSTSCSQIVAAPVGEYQISAVGYASCGANCSCDDAGLCNGAATGSPAYAEPMVFQFPTAAIHDVVFGVCAFGCPEEAS